MGGSEIAPPRLVVVAAVGSNGAIGARNGLPWRLRTDLRRYRAITLGKPMLMGRKTFASIGRPLPGRETIIVTRDPDFAAAGALVARDLEAGLRLAAARAAAMVADEIIIAGGADIYAQLIDRADALRLTRVDLAPEADAFFPAVDPLVWREVARETHPASPEDEASFAFIDYIRRDREPGLG